MGFCHHREGSQNVLYKVFSKFSFLVNKVKFTQPEGKVEKPQAPESRYTTFKPLAPIQEDFDDEELLDIPLEDALAKIAKYQGYIDKINESKKKVYRDPNMTEVSKKLR